MRELHLARPTGMDHQASLQTNYYWDGVAEASIRNKQIAREDINAIAEDLYVYDGEHQEMIQEEEFENHEITKEHELERIEDKNDVTKRTQKKKILCRKSKNT